MHTLTLGTGLAYDVMKMMVGEYRTSNINIAAYTSLCTMYINTAKRRDLLQKPASSCWFCKHGVFSKDGIFAGKNGVFSGIVYNLRFKANPV